MVPGLEPRVSAWMSQTCGMERVMKLVWLLELK